MSLIKIRMHLPGFLNAVYETRAGLWVPLFDAVVPRHRNVLAILGTPRGKLLIPGSNIVTDAGDVFLAQRSAAESPTNAFTTWEQCSAGTPAKGANRSAFTAIGSSQLAQDGTYPKTNDDDTDNTGAGTDVRTSRASYSAASFSHAAITHAIITNTTPGASEPILTGFAWAASINKTASDTLKVFHNATVNGV
jgi:hypothetical protein